MRDLNKNVFCSDGGTPVNLYSKKQNRKRLSEKTRSASINRCRSNGRRGLRTSETEEVPVYSHISSMHTAPIDTVNFPKSRNGRTHSLADSHPFLWTWNCVFERRVQLPLHSVSSAERRNWKYRVMLLIRLGRGMKFETHRHSLQTLANNSTRTKRKEGINRISYRENNNCLAPAAQCRALA